MAILHLSHVTSASESGTRADLIVQRLTGRSRAEIDGIFSVGCVKLNGKNCLTPFERVQEGDQIQIHIEEGKRYRAKPKPPRDIGFEIKFEDDHLIVVNKPPELLTVPTPHRERDTLISRITDYLKRGDRRKKAFVAHRLDRGVSGLLVFGKSLEISMTIRDQFEARKPEREYAAIVHGTLKSFEGTFRSYLATDAGLTRFSTKDEESGQLAITHYRVVKALHDATLVRVRLETGRRNQIRVHFAEKGHPVLGDPRYQPQLATHEGWPHKRLALHARLLGFTHPVTGIQLRFECDLPKEFQQFLKKWGGKRPGR